MREYEQSSEMNYFPEPQNDPYYDEFNNSSSCAWEEQNQRAPNVSYSINQEPSTLEQTFNSFMLNCPTSPPSFPLENFSSFDFASTQSLLQDPYTLSHQPQDSFHYTVDSSQHSQNSFYNSQDSFHTTQNNLTTTHPYPQNFSQPSSFELVAEDSLQKSRELLEKQEQSWKEQEILFKKMDGHLEQMRRNLELLSKEDEEQLVDVKEKMEEQEEVVSMTSEFSVKKEEVVKVIKPEVVYLQKPLEMTREHKN
ncbi:hypothetical protein AHAS_Ahas20G0167900 [Arachis hypogaea]